MHKQPWREIPLWNGASRPNFQNDTEQMRHNNNIPEGISVDFW